MLKLLSKKSIFKAKYFTVYEDRVQISKSDEQTYNHVVRKPAVSIVPIDSENNMYLIDQYRYIHNARLVEAVAGMVEKDEDALQAAKRELKEETGITANKWTHLGKIKGSGGHITWDQEAYLATDLRFDKPQQDNAEDINLVKMSLERVMQYIIDGKIQVSTSIAAIVLAMKHHEQHNTLQEK